MKKYMKCNDDMTDEEYYDSIIDEEYDVDRRAEYIEGVMYQLQTVSSERYPIGKVSEIVEQMYNLALKVDDLIPAVIED